MLNGITLGSSDYTANNGSTVVLTTGTGVVTGAVVRTQSFNNFQVSGALPLSGGIISGNINVQGTIQQKGTSLLGLTAAMSVALGA
jgi:hypothetical protein